MKYNVQQLATLANITARTLHHYDEIGLLCPARNADNDYREYDENDLLILQQILFFRELELPLDEIKKIITNPQFDISHALVEHRKLIASKKKRMEKLLATIDKTIKKVSNETTMDDKELYGGLSKEEFEAYTKEAKERWGADNVAESVKRFEALSKDEKLRMQKESEELLKEIAVNMDKGPDSPEAQELIAKHYESLRFFYESNLELYRGLAEVYVSDERFTQYYEKRAVGLAKFMHDAMLVYCDRQAT